MRQKLEILCFQIQKHVGWNMNYGGWTYTVGQIYSAIAIEAL